MTQSWEDLEGLTREIKRLIESNRNFLNRVNDEEFEEEEEPEPEGDTEDFEEL